MNHQHIQGPQADARLNQRRRRLLKSGLAAGPVVLGSMASKPVLAQSTPYHCTISGKLSGNLSPPHDNTTPCASQGSSPATWVTSTWPSGVTKGGLPNGGCNFSGSSPQGSVFNGFATGSQTFIAAYRHENVSGSCVVIGLGDAGFATAGNGATLLEVLVNTSGGIAELGRETVAALLNALSSPSTFPVSAAKVIEMFNAVAPAGGLYQVSPTVFWNAAQVITYFKSLHP